MYYYYYQIIIIKSISLSSLALTKLPTRHTKSRLNRMNMQKKLPACARRNRKWNPKERSWFPHRQFSLWRKRAWRSHKREEINGLRALRLMHRIHVHFEAHTVKKVSICRRTQSRAGKQIECVHFRGVSQLRRVLCLSEFMRARFVSTNTERRVPLGISRSEMGHSHSLTRGAYMW